MDMLRENSIKIQFRKTDKRPSSYELYRFLTDTVKLSMDAVCGIQLDNQKFSVVVKLALETRFRQILNTFTDDLLFAYSDGSTVPVKISDASAWTRAIKISGLPFELSDERLLTFLSAYGKVTTITHDLWQGEFFGSIENGDRTAVMDLKNSIPSKIQVDGHNGFVNYSGQQRTCHYCQVAGHFALSCPKKESSTRKDAGYERIRGKKQAFRCSCTCCHSRALPQKYLYSTECCSSIKSTFKQHTRRSGRG